MASTLTFSNHSLSSPFLGQKPSTGEGYSKSLKQSAAVFRSPRCTLDASFGGSISKFPRITVWDPYKLLGISRDASEEEIWSSRNFLLNQYSGHERSAESIEAAFERILINSFKTRKRTKINLKTRLKKKVEESPPWVKHLISFVEIPPGVIILRRLFLFGFMACWSVMNTAEAGPAFQGAFMLPLLSLFCHFPNSTVAISLAACIYFLNDKMKSVSRAAITGFLALVLGWVCGSVLVPAIPTFLLQPTWTLELLTSLVVYVFLFLACTYLK